MGLSVRTVSEHVVSYPFPLRKNRSRWLTSLMGVFMYFYNVFRHHWLNGGAPTLGFLHLLGVGWGVIRTASALPARRGGTDGAGNLDAGGQVGEQSGRAASWARAERT